MALFALLAQLFLMHVRVASPTGGCHVLKIFDVVAKQTGNPLMLARQLKVCGLVVEMNDVPVGFRMTIFARTI